MVVDPTNPTVPILKPLSKMTEGNKKQYISNVRVINYHLQAIPNDSYNSVDAFSYDVLYDQLVQFKPHVLASRAKKDANNHDPLAFIAHSNASSSHFHANSSYPLQLYYVTHPPSVIDYDDEYQEESQGDSQEDKLTTAMMNQVVVQDGRVDIKTKNAGYGGNANKNAGRNRTQGFNIGNAGDERNQIIQHVLSTESTSCKENVQCYNCNEKGHYAHECQKPKGHNSKYFRELMSLAMKDEARSNLSMKRMTSCLTLHMEKSWKS
nr:hypothetical protein [Tanacetum cinerariifolium]